MIKLICEPVSILASVLGGGLAGIIANRIGQLAAGKATGARRGGPKVLPAAVLQGAVVGLAKAAAGRGAAYRESAATRPGRHQQCPACRPAQQARNRH